MLKNPPASRIQNISGFWIVYQPQRKEFPVSIAEPTARHRLVHHQKEIERVLRQVGAERLYSKDSYIKEHGGKTPEDDGVKSESVLLPDGTTKDMYKAWDGVVLGHSFTCPILLAGLIGESELIFSQVRNFV